MAKNR